MFRLPSPNPTVRTQHFGTCGIYSGHYLRKTGRKYIRIHPSPRSLGMDPESVTKSRNGHRRGRKRVTRNPSSRALSRVSCVRWPNNRPGTVILSAWVAHSTQTANNNNNTKNAAYCPLLQLALGNMAPLAAAPTFSVPDKTCRARPIWAFWRITLPG